MVLVATKLQMCLMIPSAHPLSMAVSPPHLLRTVVPPQLLRTVSARRPQKVATVPYLLEAAVVFHPQTSAAHLHLPRPLRGKGGKGKGKKSGNKNGILFKGNKQASDFKVSVGGQNIEFSKSMTSLGICIDGNFNFDLHIKDICLKASRQISALQRLTGLLDLASRKTIYTSFTSSNFNYCPLVCFFTSRASINKKQKLQERALRFVLKDSISDYETLFSKSDFDYFRISSVKTIAVEIYKILDGMGPEYLSTLFSKSNVPYQLRDGSKLTQPLNKISRLFRDPSLEYVTSSYKKLGILTGV